VANIGRWPSYRGGQLDRFYCITVCNNLQVSYSQCIVFQSEHTACCCYLLWFHPTEQPAAVSGRTKPCIVLQRLVVPSASLTNNNSGSIIARLVPFFNKMVNNYFTKFNTRMLMCSCIQFSALGTDRQYTALHIYVSG
jgi:hypothetical protein